ncbi:uncharacterized protein HLK63_C02981 [Nakaseomyces glabratus]|nr:uncharacterized protein GW608_C02981 [Nakaseomyces glabratus]UCS24511.1 uncharacterized protein HLK63_C02981 [Nakaseomyces glabratus]UCS29741.1 uncharacterized protein HLK64_C02981 [Nakaseomyces glabratus]UCS34970.1 uncharacterized protein HLK62_C02981 [Nakaseomyces glabratus]
MSDFNLAEYTTRFQTSDKESYTEVNNANNELNIVTDRLAVSSEQIDADPETLESFIDLCHGFQYLSSKLQKQLTYLISSSLNHLVRDVNAQLSSNSDYNEVNSLIPQWKRHLEEYGYLTHVVLTFLQITVHDAASKSSNASKKKSANSETVQKFKNCCNQIECLLEPVIMLLEINLSRIFQTTPERDLFISLFVRPLNVLIEAEAVIKLPSLKMFIQRVIALSVKNHGQVRIAQNTIMTNLTYFIHLSNFNAELLQLLDDEYDFPQLTEDLLKEISTRVFSAKDTNGPKAISNFLIKLSELSPNIMLRQMSLVVQLLNNSSITLRCSVVEACGNIVVRLAKEPSTLEHYHQQIAILLELLQERFQDSNPYVRTKAIQGCVKVCELKSKFRKERYEITKLAVRSLEDRSSLVRRNSLKLLSKLLLTHPFVAVHGTQLKLSNWKKYQALALASLEKYEKETDNNEIENEDDDGNMEIDRELSSNGYVPTGNELADIENEVEQSETPAAETVMKLKLIALYYKEAIAFINLIHKAIYSASGLLFSRNRNEVLECMDFIVLSDAYGIECSNVGIKKMLHLVWMKGNSDEGTSVSSHLIACYQQLFLTTPENITAKEKALYIAKNLIQLTVDATVSDLTSLEQLLGMMYEHKLINEIVINTLWAIYNTASNADNGTEKSFVKNQIHGAIIVLGMLANVNSDIILKGIDSILNIGLGSAGFDDLILCRYSCIALGRVVPKKSLFLDSILSEDQEMQAVQKLGQHIIFATTNPNYFAMAENAINALFNISSKPDIVIADLIKEKTMMTFGKPENDSSITSTDISRTDSLSQLLFIVGQAAVKTLVYLEKCEAEFKKRKIEAESKIGQEKSKNEGPTDPNATANETKDNELEMIGGTNEDDFADAINYVKETELLFGPESLFGKFCPIVEEIVSNSTRFQDVVLQRSAALCLEKLMCISSKYCEKSLPLLITVMEKSKDPVIRSNAVLGLGDMAVCFNNLIDENTGFLYRRLHDKNLMVERTCLMTVTFLILAGQVKVKGQLSEMAKCLINPDQNISDMSRLFFSELATKDNAVYNSFIDIFSNLSADTDITQESFKKIMKFLTSFIEKERHQKQLVDKLIGRLANCDDQKQWDDIAYVLNTLPYKDDRVAPLLEAGFKMVEAKE